MSALISGIRRFAAWIIGIVFTVSGILKLLDPVGASLVVDEYLKFLHLGFLSFSSGILAEAMALFETLTGVALVTGIFRKTVAAITTFLLFIFTLLTVLLVIFNPVMDCGCFGEAIHLSHFQTLMKNLVLCALAAVAFIPFRSLGVPKKMKYVSFGISSLSVIFFAIWSLVNIPVVDFGSFKPGTVIAAADDEMYADASGEDAFQAVFIYEKEGRHEEFTLENLPDSTWNYVTTETRILKEAEKETARLSFTDARGEYMDHDAVHGPVAVISVYRPDKLDAEDWKRISEYCVMLSDLSCRSLVLVARGPASEEALPVYYSDYKTLISLNRSNGGLTYFNDGMVIEKWSARKKPETGELSALLEREAYDAMLSGKTKSNLRFQGFMLYLFAVLLLL